MASSDKNKNVSITMVRRLKKPAHAVYDAWTEPRIIAKWLAPGGDSVTSVTTDCRCGGRYRIDGLHAEGKAYSITGTYLELEENRKVAMTWNYDGPVAELKAGHSRVTAELRVLDYDLTELTVTHEKLSAREAAEITRVSWNSCISKLERVPETKSRPSPKREMPRASGREVPRDFFSEGHREIQDQMNTRRLADRLEAVLVHDHINASNAAFITRQNMFFLATTDAYGQPNCSYKGGKRGFVTIIDDNSLAFPTYDGNGMHLSVGNIHETNKVGLLFIDFEQQSRIRVLGQATVSSNDPLLRRYPGAQHIIRVAVESVFSNCPRYVHKMQLIEESVFVPEAGVATPNPDWKKLNAVADVLPEKDQHLAGTDTDLNKTLNKD